MSTYIRLPARAVPARRKLSLRTRDKITGYLFLSPVLLVLGLLIFFPLGIVVWDSFQNRELDLSRHHFIGFTNYANFLDSTLFWSTLARSIVWTVISVSLQVLVGFLIALILQRSFVARPLFRALFLLPWVTPVVIISLIWQWLLNDLYGLVNYILGMIQPAWGGLSWFSDANLAFPTVIVMNVWRGAPFAMVIMLAGLQTVPKDTIEAALLDGANSLQRFWHVTLPHLRRILLIVVLIFTLFNFNNFDLIYITTHGGPLNYTMTLPVLTYQTAFAGLQISQASSLAVLMLIFLIALSFIYLRLVRRASIERES